MNEKREPSRAEAVRMRRRKQSQKRLAHSSELAMRPPPPITSREGINYAAPMRVGKANTRRRFQATLLLPGVKVSMSSISLPRFEAGWRVLSFLMSLLLGTALYFAWNSSTFRVAEAQVHGNQRIRTNEINAVLSSAGQPIFTLIPPDLETRLRLNFPELSSVKVSLILPNLISVSVTERQPVILWQFNGAYTWIDDSGVALRPRDKADNLIPVAALAVPPPGLPLQNEPLAPVPYISANMVKAIKTLAINLPAGTTMTYDPLYGLGWSDSRGWKVFFGSDAGDMALKLQIYQALVSSLQQRGIIPVFISVQYLNAPYYRMSQ
jgi:POTRA domain, FtsQ-type